MREEIESFPGPELTLYPGQWKGHARSLHGQQKRGYQPPQKADQRRWGGSGLRVRERGRHSLRRLARRERGANQLLGGRGDDILGGRGGADRLVGGPGQDRLNGGDGPDRLIAGAAHDVLRGGGGDDNLQGGDGPDLLHGDAGNDALNGGPGTDTCYQDGGSGPKSSCEKPAPPPSGGGGGDSNCTPGYSPCIPQGSDVDCFGGSGNGPRYTRPGVTYSVTGSDPYALDADNDGLGCE